MSRRLFASKLRLLLPILVFVGVFFFARTAGAQALVQCGVGGGISAVGCQFCDLFTLVNNIIKYLVYLAIPIAAALFAYAGFLFFSAGGSEENIGKAKGIFKDLIIGFLVALLGFTIVNTLLQTLASGYLSPPSWHIVACVNNRQLGEGWTSVPGQSTSGIGTNPTPNGVNPIISTGDCSPAALEGTWGADAKAMSCVIHNESGCQNIPSGTDRNLDGQAFSWGRYQINLTANQMQCPGQAPLNCPSAYIGTNYQSRLKPDAASQALFTQCRDAANNPACATLTAQNLFAQRGFAPWTGYSRGNCAVLK